MLLLKPDRVLVAINDACTAALGYTWDEAVGRRGDAFVAPNCWKRLEADWGVLLRKGALNGKRELIRADGSHLWVEFAASGEVVTGQRLIVYVIVESHARPVAEPGAMNGGPALTKRELQVVTEIAMGRRVPEIASYLQIATTTVQTHVRNAMAKLGAHTQAQLVAKALAEGLLNGECVYRQIRGSG